jgi:DNA-binding NarL/FixJ family response regulator
MDVSMPEIDGVEATRRITTDERSASARVLVLTTYGTDEHIVDALRGGASGFLLKDAEPAELLRAIRVVAGGEALLAPSVTRRLIADYASRPTPSRTTPDRLLWLTQRELEVVALVAAGLNNDEIADRLVVTRATAKTHVSRAMRKAGARDRAQLVVLAYETGLMLPGGAAPAAAGAAR